MLPDAPTTCPVCGASEHATIRNYSGIGNIVARHFECGASIAAGAAGDWRPALGCPKAGTVVTRLRADNVRIGDRNVLMAIAVQAAIEGLERSLRTLTVLPLRVLPKVALLELSPIRAAYDELVDALEGAAPAPAAEVPHEPLSSGSAVLSVTAAEHEHSGGVS